MTFQERAFLLLLQTWHQQLQDDLEDAKTAFPDPEPQKERRWRAPVLFHPIIRPPTEDDPPDQWEWVEVRRTPPHLRFLEQTIANIGAQIEALGEDG